MLRASVRAPAAQWDPNLPPSLRVGIPEPPERNGTADDDPQDPSAFLRRAMEVLREEVKWQAAPPLSARSRSGPPSSRRTARSDGGYSRFSAEEAWNSLPLTKENTASSARKTRVRVAKMQETLSRVSSLINKADELVTAVSKVSDWDSGRPGASPSSTAFGETPGPSISEAGSPMRTGFRFRRELAGGIAMLSRECRVLEAQTLELRDHTSYLSLRARHVDRELSRCLEEIAEAEAAAALAADGVESPPADRRATFDVDNLGTAFQLLACLGEVAQANRSLVLPTDPAQMTEQHRLVAYFLDEVEACKKEGPLSAVDEGLDTMLPFRSQIVS
mmetsp:Transcript_147122/g.256761  ORF Transcript_147122/g.256761 Transcript_147122/m.256761 type:complete len:333 (-) Transcript_147122:76-1074(-)